MNRILSTLMMLIICLTGYPQQISREEADSLNNAVIKSKPDAGRINLLLRIAQFHLLKTVVTTADFDSASMFIKQAALLNTKIKNKEADGYITLVESCLNRKKGQREAGQQKVNEAIKILTGETNHSMLGQAYFEKANYYDYDYKDQTIRTRIYFIELGITAMKQSSDILTLAYYYYILGSLHHLISEDDKAKEEANLSLKYYQSIQYKDLEAVYSLLGKLYYSQGDYELALIDELKALQIAESNNETSPQLCEILNNLGFIYYKLNDGDNALKYFNKSLEIAKSKKDNRTIYMVASNVAEAYLKLNKPLEAKQFLEGINHKYPKPKEKIYEVGDYANNKVYLRLYVALKQFDKAKFYCDQLIQETKNPHINLAILSAYYAEIIQYYIATSQYSNSLTYLKKNKALLDTTKDFVRMARNYTLWFSLDTSERNYRSAVIHLMQANRINDSIFNETKARQFQQLGVEFETAKKTDSLKSKDQLIGLLTQKNNLQQLNLRQSNLIKNITIAGIGIILFALLLLYKQFLKNKRNNIIILQKNKELKDMLAEKEWWLKEVHHRVKNNLHTIICLLESQAMFLEKDALKAIEKTQHRIYAMSLIHQKLYQNEDVKSIDMSVYLDEFIQYLRDSFDTDRIEFVTEVEPIQLNLSQAIPVSLIINEAVTNSIKYAFTHSVGGRVFISMNEAAGTVNLTISDNGKGFIPTEEAETKSLGVQLIKGLSKEIRGKLSIKGDNGTKVVIQFKKDIIASTEQIMQKEIESYEA
jgi:two-component system, sensor histidine kinase PdtaS